MPHLILLRHGQSVWNRDNRFTGWTDVDLSERGRAEAREATTRFGPCRAGISADRTLSAQRGRTQPGEGLSRGAASVQPSHGGISPR